MQPTPHRSGQQHSTKGIIEDLQGNFVVIVQTQQDLVGKPAQGYATNTGAAAIPVNGLVPLPSDQVKAKSITVSPDSTKFTVKAASLSSKRSRTSLESRLRGNVVIPPAADTSLGSPFPHFPKMILL